MNEQELARAVQDLIRQHTSGRDAGARGSPSIPRDKWRIRLLASLSFIFWLLGIGGLILLVLALDRLVIGIRVAEVQGFRGGVHGTGLLHHSIPLLLASVAALFLGAGFTLVLILASRKATLRQINTRLAALTEQINELQQRANDTQTPPGAFQTLDD